MYGTNVARKPGAALMGNAMMVPRLCALRLIDRSTGARLSINGKPFTVYSRQPLETADEMMEGRDAAKWLVQVEPLKRGALQ